MGKTVLTIDDSKTLRLIVAKHIAPFGVKMLEAENGEQGVTRAREGSPDLILLDYNMPVMDGYHTLVELKTDPKLKPIPVMMLTTETVKETVIKLMKLGLRDYIAKPFTREVLLQKVNPILGLYNGEVPPEAPMAGPAPMAAQVPGKPAILAIDDKENILNLLKESIGDKFQVITADSGRTALAAIMQNRFEYVFLDLSLPDMNAFDVYDAYIKSGRNGASAKKVVVMPLRTAQSEIERAQCQGIKLVLPKPFVREDVLQVISMLSSQQQDGGSQKTSFLTVQGDIRVLTCPGDKHPNYRVFAAALTGGIIKEINEVAEEGLTKLVIEISEGFLSEMAVTRKFIDLVEYAGKLSMSIRFVTESQSIRDTLKQYAETAGFPVDTSVACAVGAMT
jgi:two-component system, chemotaxis family, chemotaxis protein CheY